MRDNLDLFRRNGMSVSALEACAIKLWFDADNLWVLLADGRQLSVPLAYFPRLLKANDAQRQDYIISGGGSGLHWESLDEDISVDGLLLGVGKRNRCSTHPTSSSRKAARSVSSCSGLR